MNTPDTAITELQAQSISALTDGQLHGPELTQALDLLSQSGQARTTWHAYHVIGEVLRSGAQGGGDGRVGDARRDVDFVHSLRQRLAQEPLPQAAPSATVVALRPEPVGPMASNLMAAHAINTQATAQLDAQTPIASQQQAANDSFWKWAAGFASVVAVGALAWNLLGSNLGGGAQLAQGGPDAAPGNTVHVAVTQPAAQSGQGNPNVVLVSTPNGDMLRDARLVQMMAAHKQFGGASGLQMPAGFMRNATFAPVQTQ